MSEEYFERSKKYWKCASGFPVEKEKVYPEHTVAHCFDQHHEQYIVEYGCGAGSDTISWLRRNNNVLFCDIVPENIETTKENVLKACFDLGQGPGFGFAMPDLLEQSNKIAATTDMWDVVSSHGVVHHIVDPHPVMDEFHRILKPGGYIYLMLYTEVAWTYFTATIDQLVQSRGLTKEEAFGWCMDNHGTPYARMYTEADGWDLFNAHGFEVISTYEYNNRFFRTFRGIKK